MSEQKIIAVTGATGTQGGGLVRAILADPNSGFAVRAITRDPNKDKAKALAAAGAEVVQGDLDDVESLKKAFAGAYGVYAVTNFWEHFSGEKEKVQAKNIADAADSGGTGYPQLSAEYVVSASPDVIVLADTVCCGQKASTVAARPGWDRISAVRTGSIVRMDDSIASRWGPRLVNFFRAMSSALTRLRQS